MLAKSGTYALVLESKEEKDIKFGRKGLLKSKIAYYIYIGSAFGPGGIKARVSRHFRPKKPHWHIDYLTQNIDLQEAWLSYNENRLEHIWANKLLNNTNYNPIKAFGCSDCRCYSHLFYIKSPSFKDFQNITQQNLHKFNQQDTEQL